jgi:hypothetical protein
VIELPFDATLPANSPTVATAIESYDDSTGVDSSDCETCGVTFTATVPEYPRFVRRKNH